MVVGGRQEDGGAAAARVKRVGGMMEVGGTVGVLSSAWGGCAECSVEEERGKRGRMVRPRNRAMSDCSKEEEQWSHLLAWEAVIVSVGCCRCRKSKNE